MSNYVHGWTRNILTVVAIVTLLSGCLTKEEGAGFLDGQQTGLPGGAPPQISGVPPSSVIAFQYRDRRDQWYAAARQHWYIRRYCD